jgi:LmbE family N-acetylglucosaminyl deacetylase
MATPFTTVSELGTILGVWAHPDDEAYLTAGLMAQARRNGQRVVVVTATPGELGTDDPSRWPPARLGARRRHEMAASLAALGVHEHRWLGWRDGGCALVPHAVGARQVADAIDDVRPDTIVTFGPDGMTGHPDHRAISAWTTSAWAARAGSSRLLYATVTPEFHARWGEVNDDLGIWCEQPRRPCTTRGELALQLTLDGEELDQKVVALRAHASQTTVIVDRLGEATFRLWWEHESFVAASRPDVGHDRRHHPARGASHAHR